jgi:poly(hydroxyalkanoate) depolymerase family esterase
MGSGIAPLKSPNAGFAPMTVFATIDMKEATRLTREGRLGEAMALLRRGVTNGSIRGGSSAADTGGRGQAADPASSVLDMEPPTKPGEPWTTPQSAFRTTSPVSPLTVPESLRGFLGRNAKRGPADSPGTGPQPLPSGARFVERSFSNEAGTRAYKLYVPSGYAGRPLPLVVMLHGCTQSPDDFAAGTRMNELAEELTFLVAYPAQPQSANMSKCWNWYSPADQTRDRGEPSLIAGITRRIMCDFAVDPARVYIAGLSAGGAAAAIMGSTYPDLYSAIGVHSGLACGAARDMPSAFTAMRQGGPEAKISEGGRTVATIVFHGDRDTTVNPINGDQVIMQSKAAADLRVTVDRGKSSGGMTYTRRIQTDTDGSHILEHWTLHGAGHAWSGGNSVGSYTEPRGPDASREMIRFFLQQPSK